MKKIRKAARTIILDESGKIAILEVKDGAYYKIPGDGIEEGESEQEAAIREAVEEGACDVEIIEKVGEGDFADPIDQNCTHHSICFLAKKIRDHKENYFTEEERVDSFKLLWVSFDDAIELFEQADTKDPYGWAMNSRDLNFIKKAKKLLNKQS